MEKPEIVNETIWQWLEEKIPREVMPSSAT
jgi:hypothetical protein